jgi:hypothetical protein
MSVEALDYQIRSYLGSNDSLLTYYDFKNSSVFTAQSGSIHQAYLGNIHPSSKTGQFYGKIVGASGASSSAALNLATGSGGFLSSGEGDFTKNMVEISGSSSIPIGGCSYLFSIEPNLAKDGVIFGSFERVVESVGGKEVVSSKGFNFGVNSRGKMFLQSLSRDGEYCFVANDIELSQKNVVGINFSSSQARIFRFDYLNNEIESSEFSLSTSHIKNNNLYLGSSPNFYRNSGEKLYSGKMDEFALFSGQIPRQALFEIGKSFVSDYYFTSGSVTETQVLSGYTPTFVYKTGVTGAYANITGYSSVRSGLDALSQSLIYTGNISIKEGERYYKNFADYLEHQGFLSGVHANTYNPTGENASGTLGLQNGTANVSGYQIVNLTPKTTINIPLYETVYLTGTTNQLSGIVNTPVYNTIYTTGADSSGVAISSGEATKLQKDYIYFLGQR